MKDGLLAEGAKIFVESPEFLTIRCKHPVHGAADFACGRKDGVYSDGRRPDSVEVTTDLVTDLARRDFRCNAIALNVATNELHDPFEGERDIRNRVLNAVGNPNKRLREDRLRAFRAVRFAVTKKMVMSGALEMAIEFLLPEDFASTSTERVREELIKALKCDTRATCNLIFNKFPVLGEVMAERGIWFEPTTKK